MRRLSDPPLSQGLPPVAVSPEFAARSPLAAVIAAHRDAGHPGEAPSCTACDAAYADAAYAAALAVCRR